MLRLFACVFVSLVCLAAHAESVKPAVAGTKARAVHVPAILHMGQFHGDEVPRQLGSGWLALRFEAGVWKLVPTRVSTRAVNDAVMDGPGQATGRVIVAKPDGHLLLRHPSLKPGVVRHALWGGLAEAQEGSIMAIRSDRSIDMLFAGKHYSLGVQGQAKAVDQYQSLNLRSSRHNVIVTQPFVLSENSSLLWVGDLDRDGHLDLVVDVSNHYNKSEVCLFLSRGSANRLTRVDCFTVTGC